tara:strand:- start:129 stop:305 length:177 start_codon:yes stop_codon:yes gene_type:complete
MMSVGDLVKSDDNRIGVVISFDTYKGQLFDGPIETIVEVLWGESGTGWILKSRLSSAS